VADAIMRLVRPRHATPRAMMAFGADMIVASTAIVGINYQFLLHIAAIRR
jgi:hypothetical protein